MNTTSQQDNEGLQSRSAKFSAEREANRQLPLDRVLHLLRAGLPQHYALAEVVGRWIWIQFAEPQPEEVTRQLKQLGFHWNARRQTWQHPCGAVSDGTQEDPRMKYGSRFAADYQPA